MRLYAKLTGRIWWDIACPDCGSSMSWTWKGSRLKHKKNHCAQSGKLFSAQYPILTMPIDATEVRP